jgi:hypothetical protein
MQPKDNFYGKILTGNTGRVIMYSGITKISYRKTAGHIFTKLVQIELKNFFPSKLFFIVVHISATRCSEKMDAQGEKLFSVLEYHTSKSVVTVHFMQSTSPQTRPFMCGINNLLKLGVCASRNQVVAH